jgi:carboxymethylenebutenolidase
VRQSFGKKEERMARALAGLLAAIVLGPWIGLTLAGADPAGKGEPARVPRAFTGQMVKITSGSEQIDAYLATPSKPARGALVVVHEWWGLNDWPKKVAGRFATRGYVVIVPDLYRGQVAKDQELAHELSRGLPEERALADIRAAGAYVESLEAARGRKLGVIGFCMGGGLALRAALDSSAFQATVVCYGSPVTDPARLKTLAGPVLGIFGGEDRGIGPEQTGALKKALEEAGIGGAVHVYPGVGHAFLNEERTGYKYEVARQAWDEIEAFLARTLMGS